MTQATAKRNIARMRKVLVVDDDPHIRDVVCFALRRAGFDVTEAADGEAGLLAFRREKPDLVILDVLMPVIDGLDVCRSIRAEALHGSEGGGRNVPILFLSSKDAETDRVVGLDAGGDDYIVKPFSPRELTARVNAHLRRIDALDDPGTSRIAAGPVAMDLDAQSVDLTRTEFGLLATLVRQRGKVLDRENLTNGAYKGNRVVSDRTIDSHMRRLRAKLRSTGIDPIQTVHGVGFRLDAPASDR
ncbi:MAG: response regulator transcription factor [Pseudomonadales bacterium]|nr:response regulator transcription factor [Pseudomonadales bacterium]